MPRAVRRTYSRRRFRSTRRAPRRPIARFRRVRKPTARRRYKRQGMRTAKLPTLVAQRGNIKFIYKDNVNRGWDFTAVPVAFSTYNLNALWKVNTLAAAAEVIPTLQEWSAFYTLGTVNAVRIRVEFMNTTTVPLRAFILARPYGSSAFASWADFDGGINPVNAKYIKSVLLGQTGQDSSKKTLTAYWKLSDLFANKTEWNATTGKDQALPPTANPATVIQAYTGALSMSGSPLASGVVYAAAFIDMYTTLWRSDIEVD